jgi:serine/threonine protein phosphatase PrpC
VDVGAGHRLEGHSFVAVFDGHAGDFSAKFCAGQMVTFVKATAAFNDYMRWVLHEPL